MSTSTTTLNIDAVNCAPCAALAPRSFPLIATDTLTHTHSVVHMCACVLFACSHVFAFASNMNHSVVYAETAAPKQELKLT